MPRQRRVLQVGVSYTQSCGIRDYAGVLGVDLRRRGASVDSLWWERDDHGSVSRRTAEGLRSWGRAVRDRSRADGADVVVWHYSVTGYGCRGVPVFAPLAARWVARSGAPVVVILHEFGHPWWWPGLRGSVFAATHRLALVPVLRSASVAVVTTEERQRWIRDRWWLPSVPVEFEPVFSTIGAGSADRSVVIPGTTVGVFGYGAARMRADIVVEALRILGHEGRQVRLLLVGAPGPDEEGGQRWLRAADEAGGGVDISFTGALEPAELSRTLRSLDIVAFPDEAGPTGRKTTLAAVLAHGCCVVALDGASAWPALAAEGAIVMSRPDPADLAAHLRTLLADGAARRAQGGRAADFYARHMATEVIVEHLWPLLFPSPSATVAAS